MSLTLFCNSQTVSADIVAQRIAQKMKDSLLLSEDQKTQIYNINLNLNNHKMLVRQQQISSDSLRLKIQQVENTRDSLYRPILTEQQFLLYREKKKSLINNN